MLEHKFTFYHEGVGAVEMKDMFHYRQCLGCGDVFKYPNIVSGIDSAPVCCCGFSSVHVELVSKNLTGKSGPLTKEHQARKKGK